MIRDIVKLLRLFESLVPDRQTHELVLSVVSNEERWTVAHDAFAVIRTRNLSAEAQGDHVRVCQYCFEEVCIKSVWNLTETEVPFDPDAPYWIARNALDLGRALGISDDKIVSIITSH